MKITTTLMIAVLVAVGSTRSAQATILTFTDLDDNGQASNATITDDYGDNVDAVDTGGWNYLEGNGFTPSVGVTYGGSGVDPRYYDAWNAADGVIYCIGFTVGNSVTVTFDQSTVVVNSFQFDSWAAGTSASQYAFDWEVKVGATVVASGSVPATSVDTTITTGMTYNPSLTGNTVLTITRTGGTGSGGQFGLDDINFDSVASSTPGTLIYGK